MHTMIIVCSSMFESWGIYNIKYCPMNENTSWSFSTKNTVSQVIKSTVQKVGSHHKSVPSPSKVPWSKMKTWQFKKENMAKF